jgi:signal transduction histidine kinase
VFAGMQAIAPSLLTWWETIANLLALACGLCYYIGFAPPGWLRRAWQVPELRGFLITAAALPRLSTFKEIVLALEAGAAESLGTDRAAIGLWDETLGKLHYEQDGRTYEVAPEEDLGGRVFLTQRPVFALDTVRENPEHAPEYERYGSRALLAAPISAGDRRLGVLTAYASHAPVFAEDDLVLLTLLANQAAVVLESRVLIDKEAQLRVREEITRLKDEFLSAAAHDLKTPLTTLVAQAQLLSQRATRYPEAPPDMAGIERIVVQAKRLKSLVLELLDVSRVEQGRLVGRLESVDLVALADSACMRHTTSNHLCTLSAPGLLIGMYDGLRIEQLFDNLLENAVKYSPAGGEVRMVLSQEGSSASVSVSDHGIGIAAADLPHLFDRFFRGENLNDRQFAGLGLGLFICAGIVEQHGGRIWATSEGRGAGSTFHVVLPLVEDDVRTDQRADLDRSPTDNVQVRADQ